MPPTTNPPPVMPPPVMPQPGPDAGTVGPTRDAGRAPDAAMPTCATLPTCIAALQADCMTAGACVQQRAGRNGGGGICYASGVKVLPVMPMGGMGGGGGLVTQVLKADGTLCYTVTVENGGRGGVTAYTYANEMGAMVARVTTQTGLANVTCAGETNPQVVMTGCLGPAMTLGGGGGGRGGGGATMCMTGTCM
jgi:hypothetical protein